jgi:hypothetical protein
MLQIPSLAELRRQAGLPAYEVNPADLIEEMLAAGELPPSRMCVRCGDATPHVLAARAECEKVWVPRSGGWCVAGLIGGIPFFFGERDDGEPRGRNVTVPVPVAMCGGCQRRLVREYLVPSFRVLAVASLAVGLILLAWSIWGALFLPLAGSLWWGQKLCIRRQQGVFKAALRRVPIYARLLERYPEAHIQWTEKLEAAC